eukprot:9500774-Alexandrium_andersonii.AAC.1
MLHITHGRWRIGADCSTDEHWADCRLHFGHFATQRSQQPPAFTTQQATRGLAGGGLPPPRTAPD